MVLLVAEYFRTKVLIPKEKSERIEMGLKFCAKGKLIPTKKLAILFEKRTSLILSFS
jgi:hypothetical protein